MLSRWFCCCWRWWPAWWRSPRPSGRSRFNTQRAVGRKVYAGGSSFMPLRVNYAGVMPIIFAQAILMFPAIVLMKLGELTSISFLPRSDAKSTGAILSTIFSTAR